MKILFTRHGESLANTLHIISNRNLPHHLTEIGRAQAAALADKLALRSTTARLLKICSSPVLRARETAEIVASRVELPVDISLGLGEYDCGSLEGRGDPEAWSMQNHFFHDWLEGRNREQTLPGGETFLQIRARLSMFVHELIDQYEHDSAAVILCVSHGGTLRLGLPELVGNVDFKFVQDHSIGHTDIIEIKTKSGMLTCCAWGDLVL